METKTKVFLASEEFVLNAENVSEEFLQSTAITVNSRLENIRRTYPTFGLHRAALFTAFELASELADIKAKYEALEATVKKLPHKQSVTAPAAGATPARRSYNGQRKDQPAPVGNGSDKK